jgi:hypothetical protein
MSAPGTAQTKKVSENKGSTYTGLEQDDIAVGVDEGQGGAVPGCGDALFVEGTMHFLLP